MIEAIPIGEYLMDEWIDRWTNELIMDEWIDGLTDRWTN